MLEGRGKRSTNWNMPIQPMSFKGRKTRGLNNQLAMSKKNFGGQVTAAYG